MEHYVKGETVEIETEKNVFAGLTGIDLTSVVTMRVKHGSKVRNIMGFAMRKIKEDTTKHIIFAACGPAVSKTITCVEIMKRKMKTLHQISKMYFKRIEEYWEPKEEGLDRLKVNRHIPVISVLLSKNPLDVSEPGYQAPGSYDALWGDYACQDKAKMESLAAIKRKHKDKPYNVSGKTSVKLNRQSNPKKPARRKHKDGGQDHSKFRNDRQDDGNLESAPKQRQQQQQ